jgi:hypothetical protein
MPEIALMKSLHILIPDEIHDRLLEEIVKNRGAKNKSDLVRLLIEDGLDRQAGTARYSSADRAVTATVDQLELLQRILESGLFTELALMEFLGKRPGVAEKIRGQAKAASETFGYLAGPPAKPQAEKAGPKPPTNRGADGERNVGAKDPRVMTREERAAWKRRIARELTGRDSEAEA